MFIYDILTDMRACLEFICNDIISGLADISESWNVNSQVYAGLVEKGIVAKRASLNAELLKNFPDIRMKLARKIECLEHEQLTILQSLVERLFKLNESLKMKSDGIHSKLEKHLSSFLEHNDVQHSIRENVMWIKECWSSLHCIYMQLKFSLFSLEVLNEKSAANVVDAIKQDKEHKSIIGQAQNRLQSCLMLLHFNECKSKIKFEK